MKCSSLLTAHVSYNMGIGPTYVKSSLSIPPNKCIPLNIINEPVQRVIDGTFGSISIIELDGIAGALKKIEHCSEDCLSEVETALAMWNVDYVSGAAYSGFLNNSAYLFMEVGDSDLYSLILQNVVTEPIFIGAFRQTVHGIINMHIRSFTHNDIKPKNIVRFSESYGVSTFKIVDFGTAAHDSYNKILEHSTASFRIPNSKGRFERAPWIPNIDEGVRSILISGRNLLRRWQDFYALAASFCAVCTRSNSSSLHSFEEEPRTCGPLFPSSDSRRRFHFGENNEPNELNGHTISSTMFNMGGDIHNFRFSDSTVICSSSFYLYLRYVLGFVLQELPPEPSTIPPSNDDLDRILKAIHEYPSPDSIARKVVDFTNKYFKELINDHNKKNDQSNSISSSSELTFISNKVFLNTEMNASNKKSKSVIQQEIYSRPLKCSVFKRSIIKPEYLFENQKLTVTQQLSLPYDRCERLLPESFHMLKNVNNNDELFEVISENKKKRLWRRLRNCIGDCFSQVQATLDVLSLPFTCGAEKAGFQSTFAFIVYPEQINQEEDFDNRISAMDWFVLTPSSQEDDDALIHVLDTFNFIENWVMALRNIHHIKYSHGNVQLKSIKMFLSGSDASNSTWSMCIDDFTFSSHDEYSRQVESPSSAVALDLAYPPTAESEEIIILQALLANGTKTSETPELSTTEKEDLDGAVYRRALKRRIEDFYSMGLSLCKICNPSLFPDFSDDSIHGLKGLNENKDIKCPSSTSNSKRCSNDIIDMINDILTTCIDFSKNLLFIENLEIVGNSIYSLIKFKKEQFYSSYPSITNISRLSSFIHNTKNSFNILSKTNRISVKMNKL